MNAHKSGNRTLMWSVIMSAPGPLVVGIGLFVGRSFTQVADFVRRTAELIAIIAAFVIYKITTKDGVCDEEKKARLERFSNLLVGSIMCLCGGVMCVLAFMSDDTDSGNVIPGLVIAMLGLVANSIFWRKYTRLNKREPNAIIAVQARLYRAKTFVDGCVTVALLSVAIAPDAAFSYYLDIIGSVVVAVYLIFCGIKTIRERLLDSRKTRA